MKELSVTIPVAERSYRLVIEKDHEELLRKAAKLIDKRIRDYSASYAYKDKQDLLAMVALEYATSYLQHEHAATATGTSWEQQLKEIDQTLEDYLKI